MKGCPLLQFLISGMKRVIDLQRHQPWALALPGSQRGWASTEGGLQFWVRISWSLSWLVCLHCSSWLWLVCSDHFALEMVCETFQSLS